MRILLLAPHPFFSNRGTPIAVKALIEVLAARGDRITVLTYPEGEDVEIPDGEIQRVRRIPGTRNIRPGFSIKKLVLDAAMFLRCRSLVRRQAFDLLHAVEESAFIALAMKRLYGLPFVYDMDSSLAQQMIEKYPGLRVVQRFLESWERRAVRGSTGVLAVCKSLEETALRHDPDQLVGRLEDVSLLTEDGAGGERIGDLIGSEGPVLLYVGNLEKYQGIDLMIEAFRHAHADVPDAQLVVIGGDSADIARYRERCRELGIASRCHFLGPRPVSRLGHYLRQAEVLVSPRSKGINTAMKVYSYLDSGRPVLATRLPTHTQVLDDDIARLVAPEPEAMGRAMVDLLRDDALRHDLAARARERVQAEYSPEAFRRKLLSYYESVEAKLATTASGTR